MKYYDITQIFSMTCKLSRQWGLLICLGDGDVCEIIKAAPYLDYVEHGQSFVDGYGFFLGTEEEINTSYHQTLCCIYALTCDSEGIFRKENT